MRPQAPNVPDKGPPEKAHGENFAQHFIRTLHLKLQDPSLLQAAPPPPPELFKHNDKNEAGAGADGAADGMYPGHPEAWGSPKHPFGAPPGSYKLLSSDYAWLDAPKSFSRRAASNASAKGFGGANGEEEEEPLPEPPLVMQHTRFLANARLVLIKLRQQLEEVCVGAVRRMEEAANPPPLLDDLVPAALSNMSSFAGGSAATTTAGGMASARSFGGSSLGGVSLLGGAGGRVSFSGMLGGGGRLPPGLADEVAESVRAKLCAAFEDCLSDTMDQLWGAMQYAGSKHALVDRLRQAMQQREAELEACAARQREEAANKLRAMRRQKEEIEAAAEKERSQLRALLIAANQRIEFLERDLNQMRISLETERAERNSKLDAQRAELEAALHAKEEALEAMRADHAARLDEMRALAAGLQEQLAQRQGELDKMTARATEQADMLALAFARRDGTSRELEAVTEQLEEFKRFVHLSAGMPVTEWLAGLREGEVPLMPLPGGPLDMEHGTGRAFLAAARLYGLHAVQDELRRLLPRELPWPEGGWPPAEDEGLEEGELGSPQAPPPLSGDFPPTLPVTWHRFLRAPMCTPLPPAVLMTRLADLAHAKWAADKAAYTQGLPLPDIHMFVYKHELSEHPSAAEADEAIVTLIQSLRAHKKLPRAATWLQLLQLSNPVLPPDACAFYLEAFHSLMAPGIPPPNYMDASTGVVWVSPTKWRAALTGPLVAGFDTERKAALLKQAASVRMDTHRGTNSFGMSDGDMLLTAVMGAWLSQRQSAMKELAAAWAAAEPGGGSGGVLATRMDVDQLSRVAAAGLGPDTVPQDRASQIELYFNTVQAARTSQAASRTRWSGLTVAALGQALSEVGLLPPRPTGQRMSHEGMRLATASAHMLRVSEHVAADMRLQPGFRAGASFEALEQAMARLREILAAVASGPPPAELDRRVQAGWAVLEELTGALLKARDAYRLFDAAVRDQTARMESAMGRNRGGAGGDGGKAASRPGSARLTALRGGRGARSSSRADLAAAFDAAGEPPPRTSSGGNPLVPILSRSTSTRFARPPSSGVLQRDLRAALASAHWSSDEDEEEVAMMDGESASQATLRLRGRAPRMQRSVSMAIREEPSQRAALSRSVSIKASPAASRGPSIAGVATTPSPRGAPSRSTSIVTPPGGSGSGGRAGGTLSRAVSIAAPRPLSAAAARNVEAATAAAGGTRPVAAAASPRSAMSRSVSIVTRTVSLHNGLAPDPTGAADGMADGTDPSDDDRGREDAGGGYDRYYPDDPGSPTAQRLAQLEDKYHRLRTRFGEATRTLQTAYDVSTAGGGGSAGLPSPEVLSQMRPAAKLRLVAELLAELHQECEQGVWPKLGDTVLAALVRPGAAAGPAAVPAAAAGGSPGSPSRPVSAPLGGPRRVSMRPTSAVRSGGAPPGGGARAGGGGSAGGLSAVESGTEAGAGLEEEDSEASGEQTEAQLRGSQYEVEAEEEEDEEGLGEGEVDGVPHAELQEVAGRLHAHAGHVGQVMAAAALETAALAAALEDVAGWRSRPGSSRVPAVSVLLPGGGDPASDGEAAGLSRPGSARVSMAGRMSTAGRMSMAGRMSVAGRVSMAGRPPEGPAYGSMGGEAAGAQQDMRARPVSASFIRPMSASTAPAYSSGPSGGYLDRGAGANERQGAAITRAAHDEPQPHEDDDDPRDTVYLDALRALHLAAEAEAAGEGGVGPLVTAVQELVRLLGGQPKVTADGRVIEFFPRRLPKDWRLPLLRSSLTRLYIYVCGGLLQQHERSVLLRDATADLEHRHAALVKAADELEAKAANLRGLQTALGVQLASMAAWVAHGSVMADCVTQLGMALSELKMRVKAVTAAEKAAEKAAAKAAAAAEKAGATDKAAGTKAAATGTAPLKASASYVIPIPPPGTSAPGTAAGAGGASSSPAAAPGSPVRAVLAVPVQPASSEITVKAIEVACKSVAVPATDWEVVQRSVKTLAAAVGRLRTAAGQLAVLAQSGVQAECLKQGSSWTGRAAAMGPLLPSGDQILVVNVNLAAAAAAATATGKRTVTISPDALPPGTTKDHAADHAAPQSTEPQPQQQHQPQLELPEGERKQEQPGQLPPGQQQQQQPQAQTQEEYKFVVELQPAQAGALPGALEGIIAAAPPGSPSRAGTQSKVPYSRKVYDSDTDTDSDSESDDQSPHAQGGLLRLRIKPSLADAAVSSAPGGVPQYPDAGTPAVSREASRAALEEEGPPGFTLEMAMKRAFMALSSGGGASSLPPGEALIQLSNDLLRRSSLAAQQRRPRDGSRSASRGASRFRSSGAAAAEDALGRVPPYYARRPLTARAFVEGVMLHARQDQLQRNTESIGPMPRGGLPHVEQLARADARAAAAREQQHALQVGGPEPEPATALEALLWQHREAAAAASAAATSAVVEAVSAAAAVMAHGAGREGGSAGGGVQRATSPHGTAAAAGIRARSEADGASPRGRQSLGGLSPERGRPKSGRLATLPSASYGGAAVTTAGSEAALPPSDAQLGYYPGLQVDAAGRLMDWRLPLLVPFRTQSPLRRSPLKGRRVP
ncbi:hypothetical protein Agub_g1733 [Astrephomene gubernaculifera]|uniref:Uncharacterized protein n=1 Tax=Astrephomene gubernaculifera TaxID=47775 RepID=A0AAD3HHJ8_9CHLO|nr:hypothetical protein Agub_g1733 [Astrephomene gubernaculifera]